MQTAIPGISSDAATEDMEGRNQLPKVPVMGRCRPEFDGSLGLNPNWTWLIRFPLVGVRDSLLEFLDHRLGLCVVVSSGIHAARHRLKRILTLIGLFSALAGSAQGSVDSHGGWSCQTVWQGPQDDVRPATL